MRRRRVRQGARHPFLAAETDDEISGYAYASTYRQREAYNHTLENSIYVSPGCVRQGIGMRLLSDLVQVCDQLGVRQLIAVIGDSDITLRLIYMLNADLIRSGFCHQQAINMAAGSTPCCCNAGSARR